MKSKPTKRKRRVGRPSKPDTERFVLLGSKVPPEMHANIEAIAEAKRWTLSATVRAACDLLIQQEAQRKSLAVNENPLTS